MRDDEQLPLRSMRRTLHRRIWRSLPIVLRKLAVLRGAQLLAPRITRGAKAAPPLFVVGLLTEASGLGDAARACHGALANAGESVYAIDLTSELRHQQNFVGFEFKEGRKVFGEGTLLLHIPGPLVAQALLALGRRFIRDKRVIAHWFWELQELPREWRLALPFVHEVFVNTNFVADAVRRLSDRLPVHVVPYPLLKKKIGCPIRDRPDSPFTVLFVFNVLSNFSRKNPCSVIEAFLRAFGAYDERVRLIVKHVNSLFWPSSIELMRKAAADARNIEFIADTLDEFKMNELYARADVVLSLHRSEGLGLVMAEAMLRGIPVVATNWSGNTDYLCSETGVPIGFDLVPVVDPQGNYVGDSLLWANAYIEEAATALRSLRADPCKRERLGRAAAMRAAEFFDAARYVDRVKELYVS